MSEVSDIRLPRLRAANRLLRELRQRRETMEAALEEILDEIADCDGREAALVREIERMEGEMFDVNA